jgi:hypothetical protein
MPSIMLQFPWPDLEAPNDYAMQTDWILTMRLEVRQAICDGLNRAALARSLARKGQRLPDYLKPEKPSLPLPQDRAQGGPALAALCHLVEWAMEILETPARVFKGGARHKLLMIVFSRMSWLDLRLIKAYGQDCSLLVWDAALDALLPT